jgi:hypothetical protein
MWSGKGFCLKVYGADWSEDGRVLVLARGLPMVVEASYDTLKKQDVMLWVACCPKDQTSGEI